MINKHISLFSNKLNKNINYLDLTFGNGGYVYNNFNYLISIDINYQSYFIIKKKFKKNFFIFNIKIKHVFFILKRFNFNKINLTLYDQGFNTCNVKNYFYKLCKKKYTFFKKKINNNFKIIFNKQLIIFKKKFIIIYNCFNYYDFLKLIFFLKKIKKFKTKLIKMNKFELSINNNNKNFLMLIIYV
ncbi:MAG: hypothetical protein ACH6QM_00575 [Candidatus Carsonella ruddii]